MKVELTKQDQNNIKSIISNPKLGGGSNFAELENSLSIIRKLDGAEEKKDFTDSEVLRICAVCENFSGWPVTEETLVLKKKLAEYKAKAKA